MNKTLLLILRRTFAVLILVYVFGFSWYARKVDKEMNVTLMDTPIRVSEEARELHERLTVTDLHADNLFWMRKPLKRVNHGHVDIPRLIEGNVAIQVFDAVIKVPKGVNYSSNTGDTDQLTLLTFAQRWPPKSWFSLTERALYQARKLHRAEERSEGALRVVTSAHELRQYLSARETDPGQVAGILGVEGLHALEGELKNLDRLYDAGYRILGLTHFFDNEVGGSSGGVEKGGLTEFGREVIERMEEMNLIIDLAHASEELIDDVLSMTERPVIVSHTGLKGIHDSPRNLSDEQVRRMAATGGVIGIGFWEGALGEDISPSAIAGSIRYAVDLAGIDHVALGSDFDGATKTTIDASGLILLTEALMEEGFSREEIGKIMGGNVVRVLESTLPK